MSTSKEHEAAQGHLATLEEKEVALLSVVPIRDARMRASHFASLRVGNGDGIRPGINAGDGLTVQADGDMHVAISAGLPQPSATNNNFPLAHSKSGDVAIIAGYLGKVDGMDAAVARFAAAYAEQTERDFDAVAKAAKAKRIPVA